MVFVVSCLIYINTYSHTHTHTRARRRQTNRFWFLSAIKCGSIRSVNCWFLFASLSVDWLWNVDSFPLQNALHVYVCMCVCHHWIISTQLTVASVSVVAAQAQRTDSQLHVTSRHILLRFSEQIIINLRIESLWFISFSYVLSVYPVCVWRKKRHFNIRKSFVRLHKS